MKRFILILFFTFTFVPLHGQNTVYVVFTSKPENDPEALALHLERQGNHLVTIQNKSLAYYQDFLYFSSDDSKIVAKPTAFLRIVSYIDWDKIGPGLNKTEALALMKNILSHDKIYFIDRKDIKYGMMHMIPVKRIESAF